MKRTIRATLLFAIVACSPGTPGNAPEGSWVGTITTEGNVTTVVNESGSVWGGTARLVEEASIGTESGGDEYLFGSVGGVWATEGQIYVVDPQVPVVRVYDFFGEHLLDIGRRGQGPGEYEAPWGIATTPDGLIVVSGVGDRLNVYAPDGTPVLGPGTRDQRRGRPPSPQDNRRPPSRRSELDVERTFDPRAQTGVHALLARSQWARVVGARRAVGTRVRRLHRRLDGGIHPRRRGCGPGGRRRGHPDGEALPASAAAGAVSA